MCRGDKDVIVDEARIRDLSIIDIDFRHARLRIDILFHHAPIKRQILRRIVERNVDLNRALEHASAGRKTDVERVTNVAVMLGAMARKLAADARLRVSRFCVVSLGAHGGAQKHHCEREKEQSHLSPLAVCESF